jgi:hypothetical protein
MLSHGFLLLLFSFILKVKRKQDKNADIITKSARHVLVVVVGKQQKLALDFGVSIFLAAKSSYL